MVNPLADTADDESRLNPSQAARQLQPKPRYSISALIYRLCGRPWDDDRCDLVRPGDLHIDRQPQGWGMPPAGRADGEHVPALERAVQRVQDTERPRALVDHPGRGQLRVAQHQPPPRSVGQQRLVDMCRRGLAPGHHGRQGLQRGDHRRADPRRAAARSAEPRPRTGAPRTSSVRSAWLWRSYQTPWTSSPNCGVMPTRSSRP